MKKIAFKYWPREATKEDDFWKTFLLKKFDVKFVSEKEADILFFSTFDGNETKKIPKINFDGSKIFWTGENCRINMNNCDYAFGFDYEEKIKNKNYLRLPLYVYYGAGKNLIKEKNYNPKNIISSKIKFCNYIYSKDTKERVEFFKELSKYKKIDAPGKSMNNCAPLPPAKLALLIKLTQIPESLTKKHTISSLISRHIGNWRTAVINYQKNYKFSFAFENSLYPGYTTEKIYHPMLANSIPIYWGNSEIGRDFNTKSFVNWHDYNDNKKVVDIVIDLDTNEKKYLKMLKEPWLKGNKLNKWMDLDKVEEQIRRIIND